MSGAWEEKDVGVQGAKKKRGKIMKEGCRRRKRKREVGQIKAIQS